MRIVSAIGIVWFHMRAPGAAVGFLALPLFLMLSGVLSHDSALRRGGPAFWRSRVLRLLIPWAIWSGVYLAVDAERFGWRAALTLDQPLSLLIGPSIHLWFLPFVALASGLAVAATALTTPRRVWLAALAFGPLCALPVLPMERGWLAEPFPQWSVALAPFVYGVLRAVGQARGAPGAAFAFAVLAAAAGWLGWGSALAPLLPVAALLFEGLWRLPLRHAALPMLGDLSFGIYVAHPLLALAWYAAGGGGGLAGGVAVVLGSAAVAYALNQALVLVVIGRAAPRPARG